MFEKKRDRLLPRAQFIIRFIYSTAIGLIIVLLALLMGMWGYHYFQPMSWVDAFVNAAMILSGMGPVSPLTTVGGKIFAGIYALFSGFAIILIVGIIFSPVVHRFFHKFLLDSDDNNK